MIRLLDREEERGWSDDFLLPLTGLSKDNDLDMKSYLFWRESSINDYKLILTLSCANEEKLIIYVRTEVFPILDKRGYLLENYDIEGKSIFILDMSEWALDIEMFMKGKYSKMSSEAKRTIENYHKFDGNKISLQILSVLYPNRPVAILDKLTPIQYVAQHYGLDLQSIENIGEIGSLYDESKERLVNLSDIVGVL